MSELFLPQRQKLLNLYAGASQPFRASTLPYHSVRTLRFDIRDADTTNGIAWAVARANQTLDFFSYGVGDRIPMGPQANFNATEAETNLAKAKSTNGASDFVIEGVGLKQRAMTIAYQGSTAIAATPATDADVLSALAGETPIIDPAAIAMVPQGQSPFNLENPAFEGILPFLSLEFEWDRKRTEKIGVCDLLPQASGGSALRSNGVALSENRYRIPEGYLWRRDGEPDGEFVARCRLERSIVMPISLRQQVSGSTYYAPTALYLEIQMRLFGLEVSLPSQN